MYDVVFIVFWFLMDQLVLCLPFPVIHGFFDAQWPQILMHDVLFIAVWFLMDQLVSRLQLPLVEKFVNAGWPATRVDD